MATEPEPQMSRTEVVLSYVAVVVLTASVVVVFSATIFAH